MKFRVLSLLLCLILVLSLCGCNFAKNVSEEILGGDSDTSVTQEVIDTEKYDMIDKSLVDFRTSLYTGVSLNKGYESLKSEEQKKCYEGIAKNVMYVSKEPSDASYPIAPVTLNNIELSEAQLHLVISAYTMDHPQIFWIESKFSYYTQDGVTFLQLNSGMSADEIRDTAKHMSEKIEEIFDEIDGDLTPYERELAIHDAFASRCEYADLDAAGIDDFRVYTSVGGLVDNNAVCEGYSRSMQILLSMAGIETYYVFGTGNEGLHMWNVVNLDGVWSHLDVTWNDNESGIRYNHFNLTEEEITQDHTLSPFFWELTEEEICGGTSGLAESFNIFVPECSDDDSSYYAKNSIAVMNFDEATLEKIAQALISSLDRGEEVIYLYLDPASLVYDNAIDKLFEDEDKPLIFDCIEKANNQIYYTQIDDSSVEIAEIPERNIVCVYFSQVEYYY
ncbi:MAG: hypothetical protein E7566_06900 [Ruminococcaceae bacterium]|nr:hypothetical protein [Oscillospiraceae bacterium]